MSKADPQGVRTGKHFLTGNLAAAEGAIAAGCRFFAGYPITPSTELAEHISRRFPQVEGTFIQMEDELASMAAILGGSWAGVKSMTATSGPGFSLMMENIGLGAMTETPCVVVNVQRGGPSTGLPTMIGQQDVMQARWGSHGDYEIIALSPSTPQECFDIMIKAFNLSEQFRVPTIVLMDECVSHMSEKVVIPSATEIQIIDRKRPPRRERLLSVQEEHDKPDRFLLYKAEKDLVPPMPCAGDGYFVHVTGLTHDEKGYPIISAEAQEPLVKRLCDKIRTRADEIIEFEEYLTEDAEIVVIAFGTNSRTAKRAVRDARNLGIKTGLLRLVVIWPFPEKRIEELAEKAQSLVVAEINYGQIFYEVERCAKGKAAIHLCPKMGGELQTPQEILSKIKEAI
ncbi:MAG: 2-oxoacid:acceptor oxidoreductase subunit alpha [Candidatus Heimdallarchaeota archaeon]